MINQWAPLLMSARIKTPAILFQHCGIYQKPLHYQTVLYAIVSDWLTIGIIDEQLLELYWYIEFELNVAWIKEYSDPNITK